MTYSHKQIYDDPDCPEELNDANLEPTVQTLAKDFSDVIHQLRKKEELGILPPLMIEYNPLCGFYVTAA